VKCDVEKCEREAVAFHVRAERSLCERHAPWLRDLVSGKRQRPDPMSPCCGLAVVEVTTSQGRFQHCKGCETSWECVP
jgi:hypothetical protein